MIKGAVQTPAGLRSRSVVPNGHLRPGVLLLASLCMHKTPAARGMDRLGSDVADFSSRDAAISPIGSREQEQDMSE